MLRNRYLSSLNGLLLVVLGVSCTSLPPSYYKTGRTFQDTLSDGSKGPVMVVVPLGEFTMGSPADEIPRFIGESPQHQVAISHPFAVGKYEITFADYDKYVAATNADRPSDQGWGVEYWGRGNMPVFNVTWHDAVRYTQWLSDQTGHDYRLPSEAEWEYMARAGTSTRFSTGDCINTHQANYHGGYELPGCEQSGLYRGKTLPTGRLQANAWDIYDVHGNIFEWTADCWHENYENAPNNHYPWLDVDGADCHIRVLRGGSWSGRPKDIRSANRSYNGVDFKSIFIGFRVVREL